jgi:seryl-tRNA synthetase
MMAHTPCFRSEAGSYGKDTKGLFRQHQLEKVELVHIATPEQSDAELHRMVEHVSGLLTNLELPHQIMQLCTGDTGFASAQTFDIEVWLPGQQRYREISSCSNCHDFQARRLKARHRQHQQDKTQFVHTLNGSGIAVGRTLIALIENHGHPDGCDIPKALRPFLGGVEFLRWKQ